MKNIRTFTPIVILFVITICSCSENNNENIVRINKELTEVIDEANTSFCFVLKDSVGLSIDEYMELIRKYSLPEKDVIFNFINIEENVWLSKLILPRIYPVTCIFNYGRLIDLVPGDSRESFLYIGEVLKTEKTNLDFHYNQKYGQNKIDYINDINEAIKLKTCVDNQICVIEEIDSLLQKMPHPYILYLKLQNILQIGDMKEARHTAEKLLEFNSMSDLIYYQEEMLASNMLLDSTFNATTAPRISSDSTLIRLDNSKLDSTYHLNISIYNKGEKVLKISEIHTSCSCIDVLSEKCFTIEAGEQILLNIVIRPDVKGYFNREVYIVSNSLYTPIYTISIETNVV